MATRKKSAWEDAIDFLGNTAHNVASGIGNFVGGFEKAAAPIVSNAGRELSNDWGKLSTNVSNGWGNIAQSANTFKNTWANPNFYNPTYDSNPQTPYQVENFWTTKPAESLADFQKRLETGNLINEIHPFGQKPGVVGSIGNMAANIPGYLVNSVYGQGITAPVSDIGHMVLDPFRYGTSPQYKDLNSGVAKLGAQIGGIINPQAAKDYGIPEGDNFLKEAIGNVGQAIEPIVNAWGGGQVWKIGEAGLAKLGGESLFKAMLRSGVNALPPGLGATLAHELNVNREQPNVQKQVIKSMVNTAIAAPVIFLGGMAIHGALGGVAELFRRFGPEATNFAVNKGAISRMLKGELGQEEAAALTQLNNNVDIQTGQGPMWEFLRKAFPEDFGPNGEPLMSLSQKIDDLQAQSPDSLIDVAEKGVNETQANTPEEIARQTDEITPLTDIQGVPAIEPAFRIKDAIAPRDAQDIIAAIDYLKNASDIKDFMDPRYQQSEATLRQLGVDYLGRDAKKLSTTALMDALGERLSYDSPETQAMADKARQDSINEGLQNNLLKDAQSSAQASGARQAVTDTGNKLGPSEEYRTTPVTNDQAPASQNFNMTKQEAEAALGSLLSDKELSFLTRGEKDITTPDGRVAQGKYYKSMIEVVEQGGKVEDKTLYHEAFHAYVDKFVDKQLYKAASDEIKAAQGLTDGQTSEYLAEGFADFMAGRRTFTGRVLAFFQDLVQGFKALVGKKATAEQELYQTFAGGRQPGEGVSAAEAQFRAKKQPTPEQVRANIAKGTGEVPPPQQPEGLKTPIENIPTETLQKRAKGNSEFKDAYQAELERRGVTGKSQERGFTKSARASKNGRIIEEAKAKLYGSYQQITNKDSLDRAFDAVTKDFGGAREDFLSGKISSIGEVPDFMAKGLVLMEIAGRQGDAAGQARIANHLAEYATPFGQGIQLLSTLQRMTPAGMEKFADSVYAKANEKFNLLRSLGLQGEATLTKEQKAAIGTAMTQVMNLPDGPEKTKLMTEVMGTIAQKLPPTASELFDAYRYQNILSNVLTHLRNLWGNSLQFVFTKPLTKTVAAGADIVEATLFGKERQHYLSEVPEYYKAAFNSVPLAANAFMDALKPGASINQPDYHASDMLRAVRQEQIPRGLRLVPQILEASDRFFSTIIENGEYAGLRATGMADDAARTEARKAAQHWLFRNEVDPTNKTGQGYVLSGFDRATSEVYKLRKVGLGWFVPFIKTPMNVAKMQYEYSPLGFTTMWGAKDKTNQFAKATIGTAITALGASFALAGKTTWAAPTDAKEKEMFYASGRKPYSVLIEGPGGAKRWVPFQYFGPFALALAIPAAAKYFEKDNATAMTDDQISKLSNIVGGLAKYYADQTYMQGIGNFVALAQGDIGFGFGSNLAFTAGQVLPGSGFLSYVGRILDPVYRKTDNSTFTRSFVTGLERNLPVLSKNLAAYTDPEGNISTRGLSDYILPYSLGKPKDTYESLLQIRQNQLQANAIDNYNKNELENALDQGRSPEFKGPGGAKLKGGSFGDRLEQTISPDKTDYSSYSPEVTARLKRSHDFTYLRALREKANELGMSDEMVAAEFKRKGVTAEDLVYDDKTALPDDVQLDQVKNEIEGLSGDELTTKLMTMRVVSEGTRKALLTDTLIGKLNKEGLIDDNTAEFLKTVGWDSKLGKFIKIAGSGGSKKKVDLTFDALKPLGESAFKGAKLSGPPSISSEDLISFKKPSIKLPAFKPVRIAPPQGVQISTQLPQMAHTLSQLGQH